MVENLGDLPNLPKIFMTATETGSETYRVLSRNWIIWKSWELMLYGCLPVYKSPQDDNGYDISDYQDIDPIFGSLQDMEELIRRQKRRISGSLWIWC